MKRTSLVIALSLAACTPSTSPMQSGAPTVRPESRTAAATPAPSAAPAAHEGSHEQHDPPAAPAAPAGETQRLGEGVTVAESTALAEIMRNPAQFSGRTIRTEGVVRAVCQSAGCWMQIADADNRVHVRMHGHSFFIPRNASGRRARVQGTVIGGNPNGHCEQEAAGQTGQPVARTEIDATGVELL